MNIGEYIRGLVAFEVPDVTLNAILFGRKINGAESAEVITEKQKDLCYADLLADVWYFHNNWQP